MKQRRTLIVLSVLIFLALLTLIYFTFRKRILTFLTNSKWEKEMDDFEFDPKSRDQLRLNEKALQKHSFEQATKCLLLAPEIKIRVLAKRLKLEETDNDNNPSSLPKALLFLIEHTRQRERVLFVGGSEGYSSCILSSFLQKSSNLVVIEPSEEKAQRERYYRDVNGLQFEVVQNADDVQPQFDIVCVLDDSSLPFAKLKECILHARLVIFPTKEDSIRSIMRSVRSFEFEEEEDSTEVWKQTRPVRKILQLVLYSPSSHYEQMYELTSAYYKKFDDVLTFYYYYSEEIEKDFEVRGDMLLIKGKECGEVHWCTVAGTCPNPLIPCVLQKTLKAFQWAQKHLKNTNQSVDYIVRSNISTIVNFGVLKRALSLRPLDYGGGWIFHDNGGRVDYVSGTSIIFSAYTFERLIEMIPRMNLELDIDDAFFGHFIMEQLPETLPIVEFSSQFIFVPNFKGNRAKLDKFIDPERYIFYRNRAFAPKSEWSTKENRQTDIAQMRQILDRLS